MAWSRRTNPSCSAMHKEVRPKPVAAILATTPLSVAVRTLQRSFTSPVAGLACSQKYRKVRHSNSYRKSRSASDRVLEDGGFAGFACCWWGAEGGERDGVRGRQRLP